MSGTEAVMAAMRLCRYNTRKRLIAVFGGSYHGWWDGVQPSAGNERSAYDVLTLNDMDQWALKAIQVCTNVSEAAARAAWPFRSGTLVNVRQLS